MNHLDTFSGIGGWALAARWMNWNTLAFVEKDKFCHKVLNKNFPGVPIHDDIFTFSGQPFRGRVDILTGSTPCQPFSQAGKREGSNDARHLFPEFLRVVAECRPRWVVIENVYGLLSIESGQVFEDYHACLEGEGYAVQTLCIPASGVGAPHKRERMWLIANSNTGGCFRRGEQSQDRKRAVYPGCGNNKPFSESSVGHSFATADTYSNGKVVQRRYRGSDDVERDGSAEIQKRKDIQSGVKFTSGAPHNGWQENWLEVATRLCRMDDVVPNRVDRLKSLGNAIVPQIAYEIFRAIEATERLHGAEN